MFFRKKGKIHHIFWYKIDEKILKKVLKPLCILYLGQKKTLRNNGGDIKKTVITKLIKQTEQEK